MTVGRFLKGVAIAILAALMLLVASAMVFLESLLLSVRPLIASTKSDPRQVLERSLERASPSDDSKQW